MGVKKTLKPGEYGTKRYLREYGDRLVCVRYRHDIKHKRALVTVELIVDERSLADIHPEETEGECSPHSG